MEQDQELLIQLVSALRGSNERHVSHLVNMIRSHASLQEIREYITDHLKLGTIEDTTEMTEFRRQIHFLLDVEGPAFESRKAQQVAHPRSFNVPAKPWTVIQCNNAFVSELVSLWFTWNHSMFPCIDRSLFLRDMRAGNVVCQYCSPFLVNAILADACALLDDSHSENGSYMNDSSHSLAKWFYQQAQRLHEEEGRLSLTTIQGLAVLWRCTCTFGNNHLARVYEGRIVDALRNFSTSKTSASPKPSGNEQQYDNVCSIAIWGFIATSRENLITYRRGPLIGVPQCARPLVFHVEGLAGEQWAPYPNSQPATTSHESCLINSLCSLTLIVNDICLLLSQSWKYLSPEAVDQSVEASFKRLEDWKAHVPSCMRLSDTERSSPQVLGTHYPSNARARAMRLHAAHEVARLVELRRRLWGLDRISAPLSQWITISLLTLLEDLSTSESKEAFVSLCVALRVSARRSEHSKGLLRLTQHLALQSCLTLPSETIPLYRDFQDLKWSPEDDEKFGALAQRFWM
ncbi:fungal specific transcription factor domain-containing protein [Aspergillus novofumigatus IBT 16806]|uniref:Xylanolytic transcriptional activator regulatory domain-containing protein n=1 Tax=Aspergillus novofumigatus (strain IBT 16806) TaxID=1392255 RepID=A0A2I1CJ60_ASPN1|nr:uncharacterized protein P174DRAFT_363807 [Aspergillus novofumigatus IBT 16806]PKX97669.1 hypothetical protein P174DRAFT_363807 [Aspergillus novofumigatus IBT 16806]